MGIKANNREKLTQQIDELQCELEKQKQQISQLEEELAGTKFNLDERAKELSGIYNITQLINDPENSTDHILNQSIEIICSSYLYPEICCGRILYDGRVFATENFQETKWKQSTHSKLSRHEGQLHIEVYYLKEMPERDEGPFLKEEKNLLITVANELAVCLDRKKAERETFEKAQRFTSLFDSVQDAIFIHDLEGHMLEANREACRRLNYSKEELLGMTPMDIDDSVYSARVPEILDRIKNEGHYKGETVHLTKGKGRIPTELNANIIDFDGKKAVITVARDITERKNYEKDLVSAKEKAEESARLKSSFLANLSHEIRTPLNAILGFADLLNATNTQEGKKQEYVETIKESGNKLLTIINDILDISMIESNQVQLDQQAFGLNNLLEEMGAHLEEKIQSIQKKIELKTEKQFENGNDLAYSDPQKIHLVFSKLTDNAVKFTPEGTIKIGYTVDEGFIRFYVSDTGIGVPEESINMIFQRFRQLESGMTRRFEGLGLGLSIARGLVNRMGGQIEFQSRLNQGSTVTFSIPYKKHEEDVSTGKKINDSRTDISQKTVVVAEDDPTNYYLIREYLADTSAEIWHAQDGRQVVEMCRQQEEIDLILMDIKMPVMDGITALQEIKKLRSGIPVVALTAYAYENDKNNLMEKGFDSYLSKPVDQDQLLNQVKKILTQPSYHGKTDL
jgi:PAS domain S-box-containing protein